MRILILALAALLLAAPAWADVEITLTDLGSDVIEIGYKVTDETELVRAFALNIAATDGNITAIENFAIGDNNGGFGIFPGAFAGNISVNPTTGNVDNWVGNPNPYTPLAPTGYPDGSDLPAAMITTECGSLYTDNGPGDEGVLFTITVEETVSKVCITGNAIRGNVVLENASEATLTPAEACIIREDDSPFDKDHPDYQEWLDVGEPECWCYKYQCYGDADGKRNGNPLVGYSRLREEDLTILVSGWKVGGYVDPETHPWICGDFDRVLNGNPLVGYSRIREEDLTILVTNWKDDVNINLGSPGCGGDIDLTK